MQPTATNTNIQQMQNTPKTQTISKNGKNIFALVQFAKKNKTITKKLQNAPKCEGTLVIKKM